MAFQRLRPGFNSGGFGVQYFYGRDGDNPRSLRCGRARSGCRKRQGLARQQDDHAAHPYGERDVYFCRNRPNGIVPARHNRASQVNPMIRACPASTALLMARSYPPGRPAPPDDFAVVAELVDAQR